MRTTIVGCYPDFAAASRAAAELMVAGFPQRAISIVGRDVPAYAALESRFAFAGAISRDMAGAHEDDFQQRLVCALSRLCVPPREAGRHAAALAAGGGLVAVHADEDTARRVEAIMRRDGTVATYVAGALPFARATNAHPRDVSRALAA